MRIYNPHLSVVFEYYSPPPPSRYESRFLPNSSQVHNSWLCSADRPAAARRDTESTRTSSLWTNKFTANVISQPSTERELRFLRNFSRDQKKSRPYRCLFQKWIFERKGTRSRTMKFVIKLVQESVRSNRMNRVSLTAESTTKVDKKNGKYHHHQILISPCLIF